MNTDFERIRQIFLEIVEQPAVRWESLLDEACGDDPELRQQVALLLKAHAEGEGILDRNEAGRAPTGAYESLSERPGSVIGPYKLLQQIGEGGMGTVFMAEQSHPVQRKVALKVIKPGMDSGQVIARFEAERQALAMMDHVNIARVLDAGTTGEPGASAPGVTPPVHAGGSPGRPYFVMELVHGVPITKYCDDNHLTPRERLELFVPVCQAIQHAHQKGIIHRDIKPSNVMITLYDGKPVPKVIDFGVAKATEQKLTERTLFTQYGSMVGTLEYMSPEQAEMSALGVDTRSDIYSLGVLLYELLTGSTPLSHKRVREAAYAEILRMIKEEEPPKPSTRLSDSGEALASISAQRHMEPAKLAKLVRGELDWIVMKTLEKDRNRRYETANGFAADVLRYLNDEPVQACPPSAAYRFRKFARRNRVALTTAALLSATLLLGTVMSTWQAIRATKSERLAGTRLLAETEARKATHEQLILTEQAESQATRRLFDSRLAQAKSGRLSGRVGQRLDSLDAVAEATKIARERNLPAENFLNLRNEAIACMALPDLKMAEEWDGWPAGSFSLGFDHSFTRYARTDRQGAVSIRRVADDTEVLHLPGIGGVTEAWPRLSRDGRFVAVGHTGGRIRMWKVDGVEPVLLVDDPSGSEIWDFSPDSRLFAFGGKQGPINIVDLSIGKVIRQLEVGPSVFGLAFHPNKPRFAVSVNRTTIRICDVESGHVLSELSQAEGVYAIAWHPDGKTLAAVGNDHKIHLWNTVTGKQGWVLEGHNNAGIKLNFNNTGSLLASVDWNSTLRLWDPATGQQVFQTQAAFHVSSGDRLLAGQIDGEKLTLWEVAAAKEYRTLVRGAEFGKTQYYTPSISPDGRLLAVGMSDGFGLWDLTTGEELAIVQEVGITHWLHFEGSDSLLTDGVEVGLLRWPVQADLTTAGAVTVGPPQQVLVPSAGLQMASSADGRVLASAQYQGGVVLHADHPDQPVRLGPHNDVRYIAVSPDGRLVATGSHSGTKVKVWDAESGKLVKELPVDRTRVSFSPNGKWLATASSLWSVGSWEAGPQVGSAVFAFSPDSKLLAVETGHGAVRLIDPDSGREYARLEDPNHDICSILPTFSPDGTQLVTTSYSNTNSIHIWDLRAIRSQLAEMGLDWDLLSYPPRDEPSVGNALRGVPAGGVPPDPTGRTRNGTEAVPYRDSRNDGPAPHHAGPLTVTVDLGELAGTKQATAHARQGQAYVGLQQWDMAIAEYSSALELSPNHARSHNDLAWLLATCPDPKFRDATAAVEHATRTIELEPKHGYYWNTLGVAHYRAGEWKDAINALKKSDELLKGDMFSFNAFFLAMAHSQLDEKDDARKWYDQAIKWMEKNKPQDEELKRFRAEAAELLGP